MNPRRVSTILLCGWILWGPTMVAYRTEGKAAQIVLGDRVEAQGAYERKSECENARAQLVPSQAPARWTCWPAGHSP